MTGQIWKSAEGSLLLPPFRLIPSNAHRGVLGKDWNHNYEVHLEFSDGEAVLLREDGKKEAVLLGKRPLPFPVCQRRCFGKREKRIYLSYKSSENIPL